MMRRAKPLLLPIILAILAACLSGERHGDALGNNARLVALSAFDFDARNPERKQFGALILMSAFQLDSKDKRFGGLSGLSIGADGKLYAISDRGWWLAAKMVNKADGTLEDLVDWQIAPMLARNKEPITGSRADAEALARAADGSFLVSFEGRHRIWRYDAPPRTLTSKPAKVATPAELSRAPNNSGLEGLTVLNDGRLLALTEDFANSDGSSKGWLLDGKRFAEVAYLPAQNYRVTDCATLKNGDVLVLERRHVRFGILSARLIRLDGKSIRPGAKLSGKELLRIEAPLATENFEGLALQPTAKGTLVYLISDDNYIPFQATLLLQFFLPDSAG